MPIDILMPALSPTMEKGNLSKWLKKEGDVIKSGDVLAEIETDKATMEVEAVDEGVLGKIVVPEGSSDVPVNQVIGLILEEGEDAAAMSAPKAAPKAEPSPKADAPAKADAMVLREERPRRDAGCRAQRAESQWSRRWTGDRLAAGATHRQTGRSRPRRHRRIRPAWSHHRA